MRNVGPFKEYEYHSSEDRIKCVEMYLKRLYAKDHIPYRQCVEFIGAHQGDVDFVVDAINYDICLHDFLTVVAPPMMVYLGCNGVNTSILSEDVYKVGRAWSTMKLREAKSEALDELYTTCGDTPPTPEQIRDVLQEGDPLGKITGSYHIKPEMQVYIAFECQPWMTNLLDIVSRIGCYVSDNKLNYMVKILPSTSHVEMLTLADKIYQCF